MATVYWWIVKPSEVSAPSRPSDAKLISSPDSGNLYNAIDSQNPFTYNGGTWQLFQGPFKSKSDAQSAPGSGSLGDVARGIAGGIGSVPALGGVAPNTAGAAASGAGSAIDSVAGFLSGLSSLNLWIRVAKVAIGGIILAVGLAKLTGATNGIAGKAVKAAPLL